MNIKKACHLTLNLKLRQKKTFQNLEIYKILFIKPRVLQKNCINLEL